jgi:hypothetical protein
VRARSLDLVRLRRLKRVRSRALPHLLDNLMLLGLKPEQLLELDRSRVVLLQQPHNPVLRRLLGP